MCNTPGLHLLCLCLQGVGKTTACGKLALYLQKEKKSVMMVATDVYRPAAIEQLHKLGQVGGIVSCVSHQTAAQAGLGREIGRLSAAACCDVDVWVSCSAMQSWQPRPLHALTWACICYGNWWVGRARILCSWGVVQMAPGTCISDAPCISDGLLS
jgi:hypothetical protein